MYADNIETIQDNSNEGSVEGCKGYNGGGTVYVRWGHDQCPSTAQLVYSGRAGGPLHGNSGGGSNPQCLPLDPNFLTPITGIQDRALMYGAEHETVTVIFMDVKIMMYHMQFVMSVIVLQSTWFLLSTHALQLDRMDQRVLWILDD